ncbi:porin [Pararobbsia alpina]|uniref:Porin domain-containing protein n=1 Tax=Pararobbsia alpina TaxID=621374 RepID=A0A6S7AZL0_9BURK|nr:porin [Pararobbsia alpina]CAB3782777.1 hypothetical protein LMG28138_01496 [Pararobbsia alpina]
MKQKKTKLYKALCAAAVIASVSSSAHAQSSVTLYGLIAEGIGWVNNEGGSHNFMMMSGTNLNNRFGVNIVEDLGGGDRAVAVLENGFDITSGKLEQGSRMFGRQAYVGLGSDTAGTLTLGRQYDMFWDYLTPLMSAVVANGLADHPGDADNLMGSWRYSNSVKYVSPTWNGLNAEAFYAFSNQAGDFAMNRAFGAGAGYHGGPLKLALAFTELDEPGTLNLNGAVSNDYSGVPFYFFRTSPVDANAGVSRQRNLGVGGQYDFGHGLRWNAIVDVVHFEYQDGTSFTQTNYDTSFSYFLTHALSFSAAYVYSAGKYGGVNANPHWNTASVSVDYQLSKRTDVYLTDSLQTASGPYAVAAIYAVSPSTSSNQNLVVAGMRTRF